MRNRQILGAKFRREHPIKPYIADFACVEAKLIVEIDGKSHDDDQQIEDDAKRTDCLAEMGWRVFRVRDADVLVEPDAVTRRIVDALKQAR